MRQVTPAWHNPIWTVCDKYNSVLVRVHHQESQAAARVKLGKGEAVLVDNYRVLHSREAFGGDGERRLWRVWTWTTNSDGRPNGGAAPVSTPLDIHLEQTATVEASTK